MIESSGELRISRAPEVFTSARAEIDAMTLRAFEWLASIVFVLGTLALSVAIWRILEFSGRGVILVCVGFFLLLMTALLLPPRIPLAIVSATLCTVGIADGFLTLSIYGFASVGVPLLFASTLCAGIFFGLRGPLVALVIALIAMAVAGWGAVMGWLALKVDVVVSLRSPAG